MQKSSPGFNNQRSDQNKRLTQLRNIANTKVSYMKNKGIKIKKTL